MDEDAGVKAPVTRLRRRLSVEQTEESKSPAVNTPTKKRGGKKAAAKPELELIDENTPDNSTTQRTTKKTAAKDVTSQEEKPVTPARRSRRVLSNTSLVSETALDVNSPRARRALRRASQAGSDSDAPLTPIRQSRRTRKDSASSVEKEPQLPPKQGIQITEVIIEEPEVNSIKLTPQSETTTVDQSNSPNITRKSPRLLEKNKLTPTKITDEESSNDTSVSTKSTKTPGIIPISSSDPTLSPSSHATENAKSRTDTCDPSHNKTEISQNRLSIGSAKLIKNLNTEVIKKSNFNKSWSDTESKQKTTKIPRTKSWTILSVSDDSQSYSDNLSFKSKIKDNVKSPLVLKSKSGSGDGSFNTSLNQDVSNKSTSKRKKKDSMNFLVEDINEPSEKINTIENNTEKQLKNETLSVDNNTTINDDKMQASNLFEKGPSGDVKTIVFIEDYDSNSEKINVQARHESEDQCVPVVEHSVEKFPIGVNSFTSILDKNEQNIFNKSKELSQRKDGEAMDCEPMDIDETIPEDIKISEIQSPEQITTGRSSTNVDVSNLSSEEIVNKSGRKSSITQSIDENGIETKSTLIILSQIKDSSTGDINNVVKSPQIIKNKVLSKSVHDLNITQENDIKKNSSLHYSTSTPLQDKNIQKFKGIHVNTPIVASQNTVNKNTIIEVPHISKDQSKNISETKDSESSDDDSKKPFYTENAKNEVNGKKSPTKHTSIIQNKIPHAKVKESKEKMETNEVILDENPINVNNKDVVTFKQKNESKLADVSINDKSIKPQSKIKKSKKNISSSEESEEEIVSGDDSKEKSDFIDDEAFDAGDDYESGDSQDESERRYEDENEVIDKGETLTTDDEFSDDSDYEKDSFIVSSNEEDEDLLDGTDDDLSMSDKELKMTAKSKKKFNERKVKEQKEASREMFESRHKLNSSNKRSESVIGKTKKNKRQQISSSESEEDIKPKKNNRLRLDSTKEASLVANESEYKTSMKKNKQLPDSDSSSDVSIANEREMTVCNESINEKDPLAAQIKTEPKTPQRSANSTIAFIDSEEVNNDQIDKNESTKTQTEFLDPLQATMVAYEEDDSLSSDNENIIQNYDSILKDLNKTNKVKDKVCDISLNTDNKSKKKETTSISEELNLTQVKSKKPKSKEKSNTSIKEILPKRDEDDSSLDAVDLRLLFPDDTDNSDTSSLQNKMEAADSNSEEIISLKRTEAKTDILKDNNMEKSMEISFNQSINKKNKKRKSQHKNNISDNEEEGASFFIDTVGTHGDSLNESNNHSLKEDNKNQSTENIVNKSVNKSIGEIAAEENSNEEAPLEISYQNETSSKRKSKTKDNIDILMDQTETMTNQSLNVSKVKTLGSEKKKADIKSLADNSEDPVEPETSQKKKRKKSASNSFTPDETSSVIPDNQEDPTESKTSEKVKRKKSASNSLAPHEAPSIPDNSEVPIESETSQKKKRKKSASNSFAPDEIPSIIPDNPEVPIESETSQKKERKKSASNSFAPDKTPSVLPDKPKVPIESETSQKKKRKKSASNSFAPDETTSVLSDKPKVPIESETSQKKEHKKFASNSFAPDETPSVLPDNPEVPIESETSQKKKRKKPASNSFAPDETPSIIPDNPEVPIVSETSQKKKRKKSASNSVDNVTLPDVNAVEALNQSTVSNKKKKRKIADEDGTITVAEPEPVLENYDEEFSTKKQDKKMVTSNVENHSDGIDKPNKKRNRKRKERDEEMSTAKMLKENIFAKVPRLPPTVLEKLDDVSHKEIPSKKPKLESTTSFAVEEIKKKKNKPSKYLEESVYITEDSENRRNQKKRIEKPKVLPFMPTVSTSTTGFTTNFKVDVLPAQITFVAQTNTVTSFRDEHLYGKRIRRLRTYDKYKTQRNLKLTKF